jgi:hypothetical protein
MDLTIRKWICKHFLVYVVFFFCVVFNINAQNPIIRDQYSADPSVRIFNEKIYLFPSHDILGKPGQGRAGWFCMEDYHVFSSENLSDWNDHGVIVKQNEVPWVKKESYSMWAPDCIYKNGKYYFYFPTTPNDTTNGKQFAIGVAIADRPEGPYIAHEKPIANVHGIDPNIFIDKNGEAYLYWSAGNIFGAKLNDNMLELASDPLILTALPETGLKEGPYMIERNGIYYLTYPHVADKIERLEYATGSNPLGPFKFEGVIMDESSTGCWTNHHSLIEYKKQWYLFYHHNDYSPKFDKNRSVRIDSLFFLPDGTIKKVRPTLRGVGTTPAHQPIQIDRYSNISETGVKIEFIDNTNRFLGWKVVLDQRDAWVQYNGVDFKKNAVKSLVANVRSIAGGTLQIRLDNNTGPIVSELKVPPTSNWKEVAVSIPKLKEGVRNVVVVSKEQNPVEIDWIKF